MLNQESPMDNHNNNKQDYLLAIDNGTQSVRALLFDLKGNLLGKGKVELEAYFPAGPAGPNSTRTTTGPSSAKPANCSGSRPASTVRRSAACP